MYSITKTEYGLHCVMGGVYAEGEIPLYIAEKDKLLRTHKGPYSLLIDLRTAMPPAPADAKLLKESQERQKADRLERMAIIVASPVLQQSAKQVGFLAGMEDPTRIINANESPDWEQLAMDWILRAIEPELSSSQTGQVNSH